MTNSVNTTAGPTGMNVHFACTMTPMTTATSAAEIAMTKTCRSRCVSCVCRHRRRTSSAVTSGLPMIGMPTITVTAISTMSR
jgi:hypothetical protein